MCAATLGKYFRAGDALLQNDSVPRIWIVELMNTRLILFFMLALPFSSADGGDASVPLPAKRKPHPDAVPNIHAPGEVDRVELVPFIVADPTSLPGIVVDETEASLEGSWQYSTHTPPYVGIGYLHDQREGKGAKSVTFTPTLPRDGWYEVRLAHCYNVRRATNTPVMIRHSEGETSLRINQQQEPPHGRLWRSLGTFRFAAGRTAFVRISNQGTDGSYVIADAVQFLPAAAPHVSRKR
jgi:hypothetical protein